MLSCHSRRCIWSSSASRCLRSTRSSSMLPCGGQAGHGRKCTHEEWAGRRRARPHNCWPRQYPQAGCLPSSRLAARLGASWCLQIKDQGNKREPTRVSVIQECPAATFLALPHTHPPTPIPPPQPAALCCPPCSRPAPRAPHRAPAPPEGFASPAPSCCAARLQRCGPQYTAPGGGKGVGFGAHVCVFFVCVCLCVSIWGPSGHRGQPTVVEAPIPAGGCRAGSVRCHAVRRGACTTAGRQAASTTSRSCTPSARTLATPCAPAPGSPHLAAAGHIQHLMKVQVVSPLEHARPVAWRMLHVRRSGAALRSSAREGWFAQGGEGAFFRMAQRWRACSR